MIEISRRNPNLRTRHFHPIVSYIIFSGVGFAIGGFSGIDYIVMQIHYAKAMKRRYFMRFLAGSF